jgi:UDPglucose 6-dehydrogenase
MTKICVVGIWHLGSVYSACLAELGYDVTGVDENQQKVVKLNKGIPPLFEPGLSELIIKNMQQGKLVYTDDLAKSLSGVNFVFITFDTTVDDDDNVDLTTIWETVDLIAEHIKENSVVIVSSQVPVGTCHEIKARIQKKTTAKFDIAYVPENLQLGKAINRFMHPERIVIGSDNESTTHLLEELFAGIADPKIVMDIKSAEMTKHALNAFLATSISFINEIANISDKVGADALKVSEALKLDSRIGSKAMLKPGLGFSGGTLARDIKTLQKVGNSFGCETLLIDAVYDVNTRRIRVVEQKLLGIYPQLKDLKVSVFGLTYKAGTSTLRRSVSLEIIKHLIANGAVIRAYDPKADLTEIKEQIEFEICTDPLIAAQGSNALIFVTDWPEFRQLDFASMRSAMAKSVLIDVQNMLDADKLAKLGFLYLGVGRGKI